MAKRPDQWSARAVPGWRRELADAWDDAAARRQARLDRIGGAQVARMLAGDDVVDLVGHTQQQASALRAADLYWVTGDMAAQALDASQDVPGFTTADLISPSGLVLFQAPLPDIDTPRLTLTDGTVWAGRVPVWGLWWHPRSADQTVVEVLTRAEAMPGPMVAGAGVQPVLVLPVSRHQGIIFDDVKTIADSETGRAMPRDSLGVLALLSAMSVLMTTPTIAERRTLNARTGRTHTDENRTRARPADLVTTIDLRPLRHAPETNQPSSDPGREYRHRWIVRGHWTHQPHGPRNSLRKLTYRAPYIKGPPDAPLLATQKVMVWRR